MDDEHPTGTDPIVRFEVKSLGAWLRQLPLIKSVFQHGDVTHPDNKEGSRRFFVEFDDSEIQDRNADLAFAVHPAVDLRHATAAQTEDEQADLEARNSLERMMMARQEVELEAAKLKSFGQVTTVLFLLYNVLTNNVFALWACFDMDYGDSYNRFDLELDCNEWSFKNLWQTVALACLFLYPLGIPLVFGLMVVLNRHVLREDPTEELKLEEFANVVTMIDDNATIKDIATIFDDMDEDGGGTVSLSELRSGAVQLGLKVKQKGADTAVQTGEDITKLTYGELDANRKEDVRRLLNFPGESPVIDRLRTEHLRWSAKHSQLTQIKERVDNILYAINQCTFLTNVGPPSLSVDASQKFKTFQLADRPLIKWADLSSSERAAATKLKFEASIWDAEVEADGSQKPWSKEKIQQVHTRLGLWPNPNTFTKENEDGTPDLTDPFTNTDPDEVMYAYGGHAAFADHIIADLPKPVEREVEEEFVSRSEETIDGDGKRTVNQTKGKALVTHFEYPDKEYITATYTSPLLAAAARTPYVTMPVVAKNFNGPCAPKSFGPYDKAQPAVIPEITIQKLRLQKLLLQTVVAKQQQIIDGFSGPGFRYSKWQGEDLQAFFVESTMLPPEDEERWEAMGSKQKLKYRERHMLKLSASPTTWPSIWPIQGDVHPDAVPESDKEGAWTLFGDDHKPTKWPTKADVEEVLDSELQILGAALQNEDGADISVLTLTLGYAQVKNDVKWDKDADEDEETTLQARLARLKAYIMQNRLAVAGVDFMPVDQRARSATPKSSRFMSPVQGSDTAEDGSAIDDDAGGNLELADGVQGSGGRVQVDDLFGEQDFMSHCTEEGRRAWDFSTTAVEEGADVQVDAGLDFAREFGYDSIWFQQYDWMAEKKKQLFKVPIESQRSWWTSLEEHFDRLRITPAHVLERVELQKEKWKNLKHEQDLKEWFFGEDDWDYSATTHVEDLKPIWGLVKSKQEMSASDEKALQATAFDGAGNSQSRTLLLDAGETGLRTKLAEMKKNEKRAEEAYLAAFDYSFAQTDTMVKNGGKRPQKAVAREDLVQQKRKAAAKAKKLQEKQYEVSSVSVTLCREMTDA